MNEEWILNIKRRLRRTRKERGLSAQDVADSLNVSGTCVYKWETENNRTLPTIDHVMGFCLEYHVSADWLLFGRGEEQMKERKKENEMP